LTAARLPADSARTHNPLPDAVNREYAGKPSRAASVRDTGRTTYLVTSDGEEERCDTPEEVSRIVAQYQLEHPDDPNLRRISVARRSSGADERLPAQQFLPEQIP
jgi:hypothetical protein